MINRRTFECVEGEVAGLSLRGSALCQWLVCLTPVVQKLRRDCLLWTQLLEKSCRLHVGLI